MNEVHIEAEYTFRHKSTQFGAFDIRVNENVTLCLSCARGHRQYLATLLGENIAEIFAARHPSDQFLDPFFHTPGETNTHRKEQDRDRLSCITI
jgi:hypothetical protein